ncbi:MAG: hypothetical protein P8I27_19925 [Pirellulaceae bacterium]|nr:hypothetical protein [Pirellulaceae bacterium]
MWRRGCLWLSGILILGLSILIAINIPYQNFGKSKFKISPATTTLTGPLKADGSLDYVAAVNQRHMDGVKSENNAVAVIFRLTPEAFYPESAEVSRKAMREQFATALGFEVGPSQLELEDPEAVIQKRLTQLLGEPAAYEQTEQYLNAFRSASKSPWKSTRFPDCAEILHEQRDVLDLIVNAATRPRYYHPFILPAGKSGNATLLNASLPIGQRFRQCARLLLLRAMNSLGDGEPGGVESAIRDIQSARRLGWLQCQSISLTEKLIVAAIYRMVNEAEINLIDSGHLTTQQLQEHQAFIREHKYPIDMGERIDFGERILVLDQTQALLIDPVQFVQQQNQNSPLAFQENLIRGLVRSADTNTTLRVINQWFDRYTAAAKQPTIQQSLQAFEEIEDQLSRFDSFNNLQSSLFNLISGPKSRGKFIGNLLAAMLMPAGAQLVRADFDLATQDQLNEIAFAISSYRSKYHAHPAKLTTLVPEFLEAVKPSPSGSEEIQYRFNESGFMVYSIGSDGIDNGGRLSSELNNSREYDIRVSVGLLPTVENGSRKKRLIRATEDEKNYREKLKIIDTKSREENLDTNRSKSKKTS